MYTKSDVFSVTKVSIQLTTLNLLQSEIYTAYTDYKDVMDLTEGIISDVAKKVSGTTLVPYGEHEVELKAPWKRIHMVDAIKEVTGVDFWPHMTDEEARAIAKEKA